MNLSLKNQIIMVNDDLSKRALNKKIIMILMLQRNCGMVISERCSMVISEKER